MKTKEVAERFADGKTGVGNSVFSTGDKFFSYSTCLAQWVDDNIDEFIILNETKYSVTSSRHYGVMRSELPSCIRRKIVKDVPRGTNDLKHYL